MQEPICRLVSVFNTTTGRTAIEPPSNGLERKRERFVPSSSLPSRATSPSFFPALFCSLRCKSAAPPCHLRELAKLPRNGSSSGNHYHRRIRPPNTPLTPIKQRGRSWLYRRDARARAANVKGTRSQPRNVVGSRSHRSVSSPILLPHHRRPTIMHEGRLQCWYSSIMLGCGTTEDFRQRPSSSPGEYMRSAWAPSLASEKGPLSQWHS
jgi:hypothetical protein